MNQNFSLIFAATVSTFKNCHLWKIVENENFDQNSLYNTYIFFYSSNEYLSKDIGQIPIDERFIYKYLKDTRSRKTEDPASDDESVNSEDFNEALNADMNERDLDFASNIENLDDDLDDQGDEEDSNEGM